MGSWNKEDVCVYVCVLIFILGFFCLVFVIPSIPERDKQHFQGEEKNHVIRKQRRVRASHFHVSLPPALAYLIFSVPRGFHSIFRFGLFSVILLSPFVLSAQFLIGSTYPLCVGNK